MPQNAKSTEQWLIEPEFFLRTRSHINANLYPKRYFYYLIYADRAEMSHLKDRSVCCRTEGLVFLS